MKPLAFSADLKLSLAASATSPRRFSMVAYTGGKLNVSGWDKPVIIDLAGLKIERPQIPILIDHKKTIEATLGQTDAIENTGQGLILAGLITGQSDLARQVLAQADAGHQWQASIGCIVEDYVDIPAGQTIVVNGQSQMGPAVLAKSATLRETSVLPAGGDGKTVVNLAARAASLLEGSLIMGFEDWLKSKGLDAATLTPDELAAFQLAYDALQAPTTPADPSATPAAPVVANGMTPPEEDPAKTPATASAGLHLNLTASLRQTAANELRRQQAIQTKAAGHPMIAAKAIEAGWSADKTELEVLRATQRQNVPATSFRGAERDPKIQGQVLEAAVCTQRRVTNVEKQYPDQVLQAAHTQFRGRVGLQQLILQAAVMNGYRASPGERLTRGNHEEILRYACPDPRNRMLEAAAFSTVSLPGILSNIANKELLTGYMFADAAWRQISGIKSVSDFKQVTSYRMLDNMEYEQLGPGGIIKGGSVSEENYTRQVKTYAKMFTLTREDQINDDLGAFDDLRNRVGMGAGQKLSNLFWTEFLDNSAFFTSGRTNYISGSTTNLGTDGVGLGLGVKAFRLLTSPSADGSKMLDIEPEILLIPPELEQIADALYRAGNLDQVAISSGNTFTGKYRPVVGKRLSNTSFTGYSTTAWYLLGNPSIAPTVVVSFLDGVETPTVETSDADFNTLGFQFRGYHDFGVDQAEYLGGIKSKGAA